jgi:predicted AAA+ superfamily ATPase
VDETKVVGQLLHEAKYSRDQLPYTDEFARLKRQYETCLHRRVTDSQFWRSLVRVGKRGKQAREKSRKVKVPSPKLTTEQQLELLRLLPDGIGNRDQLPYTDEFDRLRRQFNKLTRSKLDQREFWRVLSRVGKRSRKPQPIFQSAPLGGLHEDLVKYLEVQNPWWRGKLAKPTERFRRWGFMEAMNRLERNLTPIVAIRGSRQVGKTTIQEQLIEELLKLRGVEPNRIFRVEFEDAPKLGSFTHPILALVRWFEDNVLRDSINAFAHRGEPVYLILDEVQNLKTWATQLKALVDHIAVKTLVTGSSALRIGGGQDSLVGRISMIELGPLRLGEIAGVRQFGDLPPFQADAKIEEWTDKGFWLGLAAHAQQHAKILKRSFDAFSDVGGYPVCHKSRTVNRSELLSELGNNVVKRTLDRDLKAGPGGPRRRPEVVGEAFKRICRYAGRGISPRRIREEVAQLLGPGVPDKSVRDAIRFLSDALLVCEVPPLEALGRKQAHPSKLCLCDHIVRELLLQEMTPISPSELARANEAVATTAGFLMESDIGYYLKGIPGLGVSWLPPRAQDPEVDFVLTIGLQRIPVEVKYRRGGPKPEDRAGLKWFCGQAKYNAPFGLLITQEASGLLDDNIIALPAYALLSVR